MEHQAVSVVEVVSSDIHEVEVRYGRVNSHLGEMLIGSIEGRLCWLGIYGGKADPEALMRERFKGARFTEDLNIAKALLVDVMAAWHSMGELEVVFYGTEFQKDVWQMLLAVPYGEFVCYEDIAVALGKPKAVRAVGTAVGKNPISLVIPCHRVLPKSGGVGNYLWGSACKQRILNAEMNEAA